MDKLQMWGLISGFITSFVLPILQQPHWSTRTRSLLTFGICLVVGVVVTWMTGNLNLTDITTTILAVMIGAITAYKSLVQPTGLGEKIEAATAFRPPAIEPPSEG